MNGVLTGFGTFDFKNGNQKAYEGQVLNGLLNGKGKLTFVNK